MSAQEICTFKIIMQKIAAYLQLQISISGQNTLKTFIPMTRVAVISHCCR
jgi:hypothetical protein